MNDIHLIDLQEQPVVGVRQRVRMEDIKNLFDTAFEKVLEGIRAAGAAPAGAPYARYFGRPEETVDVEIGFPVQEPFPATGDLVVSTLPAARAAEVIHAGPYDTLPDTYRAMEQWIAEHQLQMLEESWEIYEAGPVSDPDPATWRTRILFPVSGPQVKPA
ncbi:GyrI-like domain-containing protein [Georgenia ruanii]|uniref:AraC family transcriptional regulator n=1 Tax=Georgenia ruanii TaxID=348442 RepID=A0A7J9UWB9_9MICO|nr:GyrI-like domain-containing protein [Georgenia ruanii]MPV88919.1 AraC family transcriptional regulator [Georgenia ruanii]